MMLIDASGLLALLNARDAQHGRCRKALAGVGAPLATVWPALAQALAALRAWPAGREAIWDMIERGALRILPLTEADVPRIRELAAAGRGRRALDMAHACFVRVAEREGVDAVLSLDRAGFERCRIGARRRFRILPGTRRRAGRSGAP